MHQRTENRVCILSGLLLCSPVDLALARSGFNQIGVYTGFLSTKRIYKKGGFKLTTRTSALSMSHQNCHNQTNQY